MPERFLIAPGPDVFRWQNGRYVCQQRHNWLVQDLGRTLLRETLRRASRLISDPDNFRSRQVPNWWIGVGTALGFAREGNFIAGDSDVDLRVGLNYTGNTAALAASEELVRLFRRHGFILMREAYWDGRPMQTAFIDPQNANAVLDIYYFYEGISEGRFVNASMESYRRKPRELIDNKRATHWPGYANIKVNVPHPIEEYLLWRFGPEWRTPKKNSELGPIDLQCFEPLPRVTVLTYGTWDLYHYGHASMLERASAMGDHLVVGVVSDEVCRIRGKRPAQNEQERTACIRALPFVREVFIQGQLDQKEADIERFGAAHLVIGDDWKDHPRYEQVRNYRGVDIHYLPRTPGISSTALREAMSGEKA